MQFAARGGARRQRRPSMTPPLGAGQTEGNAASAGAATGTTDQLERWLEAALALSTNLPPGQLSSDTGVQDRAAMVLEEVRAELKDVAPDLVQYFETSRPRYQYTLALALASRGGRALDVGCSPGHLSMGLVKAGFEVQGIDLNPAWQAKYAPGWAQRLHITHTDIEKNPMPFPSASFDLVIFTEVLEHIAITDPGVVLGEIRRVLRPGGRMVLSTPNVTNLSNVVALIQGENVFWPPEIFYGSVDRHNREYTPGELMQLVQRTGFAHYELGYMNTWSNWHHTTGPLFHRLLDGSQRAQRIGRHPLFNNTLFVVATR
jgi:2-polyprenyl-3-methyl-5-hydroxy-6-metoxy-1,4-benzoquinol methylase